jgi:hypothetical protein
MDKTVKPKIVASTATVRKAKEQVNNVFMRRVSVFPPHGLDVEDNYFSVQRPIEERPGRRYLGVCSPGSSRPAMLIRVYTALLTAAQALFDRFGEPIADPYMTTVGYFNSLRELGGMRRLAEDDVQTRSYRVQMSMVERPALAQRSVNNIRELTSRVSSQDIPKYLDDLEVKFKADVRRGRRKVRDEMERGRHPRDRRGAGDQHAVGRRGRESLGPDGGERPAQGHGGIHPSHQPRGPFFPRLGLHGAHVGAPARPLALRDLRALPRDLLQACGSAVGDAILATGDGSRPDRRTPL